MDIAVVVIAVSSPHRKVAYEANEYAIERIKRIVPIWKKEFWEDGTMWVGDQLETHLIQKENQRRKNEKNDLQFYCLQICVRKLDRID